MASQGDISYFNGSQWVRLAAGTVGQVLRTGGSGANPAWAYHHLTHVIHGASGAVATFSNMPAAATLLFSSTFHVRKLDLTNYTQGRLIVSKGSVAGNFGSKLILRYHTSFSSTASDYSDIGTSEVSVAVDSGVGGIVSSWVNLATGAKADVWIAVIGTGGDGAIDPTFGTISAEFR